MASVVSRESFFEAGLDALSDLGYGGLKLAEVCNRLGVTTGSFYHYFSRWPAYTKEFVAHWMQQLFAGWGVCLLVGYEQANLPRDRDALERITGQLLDALDSGRFATVPDGD
jgi:hypothetical protein